MIKKVLLGIVVILIVLLGVFVWYGVKEKKIAPKISEQSAAEMPSRANIVKDPASSLDISLAPQVKEHLQTGPGMVVLDVQLLRPGRYIRQPGDLGVMFYPVSGVPASVKVDLKPMLERLNKPDVTSQLLLQMRIMFIPGGVPNVPVADQKRAYAFHRRVMSIKNFVESNTPVVLDAWVDVKHPAESELFLAGSVTLPDDVKSSGSYYLAARRVMFEDPDPSLKIITKHEGDFSKFKGRKNPLPFDTFYNYPVAWTKIDPKKPEQSFSIRRENIVTPDYAGPLTLHLIRCPNQLAHDPMLCIGTAMDVSDDGRLGTKDIADAKDYENMPLTPGDRHLPMGGETGLKLSRPTNE